MAGTKQTAKRRSPKRTTPAIRSRIVQGDCIKLMSQLDAGCIDLAFADPPFNIGYDYDEYDDRRTCDDYIDWSREWMSQVVRILKPDGTFWLAIGDEYAAELKVLATRELGLTCRSWVVWYYTFGVHCVNKFTRSHAHLFHFVKDAKQFTFNVDDVRVPSARQLVYADKRANPKGRVPDDTWMIPPHAERVETAKHRNGETSKCRNVETSKCRNVEMSKRVNGGTGGGTIDDCRTSDRSDSGDGRSGIDDRKSQIDNGRRGQAERAQRRTVPKSVTFDGFYLRPQDVTEGFTADGDVWYFPRVCGTFKEREGFHGCQMPERLLARIVRACSNEGDRVFDPFTGSGTTLAVAKKLHRQWLGFELSKDYAAQAAKRLEVIKPGAPLDGVNDPLTSVSDTANGNRRGAVSRKTATPGALRARRMRSSPPSQLSIWPEA